MSKQKHKIQKFNGKSFYKKPSGYYKADYVLGGEYMHRYVWCFYNGEIKQKHHIHHKDGDKSNNHISNLEEICAKKHTSLHSKEWHKFNKKLSQLHMSNMQDKAKLWHGSVVGRKWHSEHAKLSFKNRKPIERQCIECKKHYMSKFNRFTQKFCSGNCASTFRRKSGVDNEQRVCQLCRKKVMVNRYSETRFCSLSCSARGRNKSI
jgi:hypothetical protein